MIDFINFYIELFKHQIIKLLNYSFLKDVLIPVINVLLVWFIFHKTNKNRLLEIEDNRKYESENNRPVFVFIKNKIDYYETDGNFYPLDLRWKYNEDVFVEHHTRYYKDEKANEFEESIFNQSKLKFKNVGQSVAYDIEVEIEHIDSEKYLNQANKEYTVGSYEHKIHKHTAEDGSENISIAYEIVNSTKNKAKRYTLRNGNQKSNYKFRVKEQEGILEVPLDKSDRYIFNHTFADIMSHKTPYIKVIIKYNDKLGYPFKDEMFIGLNQNVKVNIVNVLNQSAGALSDIHKSYIDESYYIH
ncbi:hypothetical protein [Macrococcoides caseolyticum]|uniref:hypothetical protein n=2 Tax=Macrococcoides caseolyticum TaxID=69966 RepID=UPI000C339692|nr:hypothetical protein [Macrococcus caseolyticus]PKE61529.1 hypothetical protein CW669_03585 [Macrococcus caseolyticus]